jgi:putative heme-binding domain-containing protein
MKSRTFSVSIAALALAAHALAGADPRGDNPGTLPSTPEQEKAKFHLPPGFEIQLVAAEPEIQKPINITFDGGGRLWVTGSEMYPWPASVEADGKPIADFANAYAALASAFHVSDEAPPASNVARDTVRVLSDFDETGRARKISVFADGLNIPSGVQPLPRKPGSKGDTVIVYSIPNIWRLEDTTGNGRADQREVLYGTAGFLDTHGGMSSFLYWMDGWIYGTHGFRNHSEIHDKAGRVTVLDSGNTYRFRPDGSAFEIYSHGQTNPFGLTVDPLGNFYTADSHSRPVYMLLRGAWYEGINKQHDGLGFAPRITDDDHGSTAIGGIAYYADDKWPEEYRGNTFNGNVVTQKINRDKLEWHGSTPQAIRMPDFLTSDDPWFRPVQVKLGPDGALWIADFYNPIIGHYEVPLTDPHRDHTHGRIWRIVYRGVSANDEKANAPDGSITAGNLTLPDFAHIGAEGLLKYTADPNLVVRTLATNELADRVGKDALPQLKKLTSGEIPQPRKTAFTNASDTIEAYQYSTLLWAMERLGEGQDLAVSCDAFSARSPSVLATAARIYSLHFSSTNADTGAHLVTILAERLVSGGKNALPPEAKRAFVEVLGLHPANKEIAPLVSLWKSTPSEDSELIHAVRMALRDNLVAPNGYAEALVLSAMDADTSEKIADVSLGAPTSEAAEYLLGHLKRTNLATPRAGEYLRHAALNIAPERIPAVAALLDSLNNAPLTQRLSAADGLTQAARQRGVHLPDATTAWLQRTMVEALGSSDDALLKRAIESVREAKIDAKFQPLTGIVDSTKRAIKLRVSALEAIANIDQGRAFLSRTLASEGAMQLRKRAAELLAQSAANPEVAASLLAALPTAPGELASVIGAGLATTDDSCDKLLGVIEAGKASPTLLRNVLVAALLEKRPEALRARAAVLTKDLPPEDARLDKVIAARVDAFGKANPDPAHGAQVFQQTCAVCHRFKNIGAVVGPQLDGIKTRGIHRVIEDILDPNRNVDPMFRQTIVETTDGQTIAGLNARVEGELLTLTDPTGKPVSVPRAKVKMQTQTRLSLMPPGFESVIPPADFNDLLSYLLETAQK